MDIEISPERRDMVKRLLADLVEGASFEFTSPVDYNYNCVSRAFHATLEYSRSCILALERHSGSSGNLVNDRSTPCAWGVRA